MTRQNDWGLNSCHIMSTLWSVSVGKSASHLFPLCSLLLDYDSDFHYGECWTDEHALLMADPLYAGIIWRVEMRRHFSLGFFPRSGGKLPPQRLSIWCTPAGNTSDPVQSVLDRIFSPSKPTKCREQLKNDILWIPTINSAIVIFHFIWAIDNSHSSPCLCPVGRKIKAAVFNLRVGIA